MLELIETMVKEIKYILIKGYYKPDGCSEPKWNHHTPPFHIHAAGKQNRIHPLIATRLYHLNRKEDSIYNIYHNSWCCGGNYQ